jgi:hypothetical protein
MTDEFLLDCEAIDLVGEAMFPDSWYAQALRCSRELLSSVGTTPTGRLPRWTRSNTNLFAFG